MHTGLTNSSWVERLLTVSEDNNCRPLVRRWISSVRFVSSISETVTDALSRRSLYLRKLDCKYHLTFTSGSLLTLYCRYASTRSKRKTPSDVTTRVQMPLAKERKGNVAVLSCAENNSCRIRFLAFASYIIRKCSHSNAMLSLFSFSLR